MVPINALKEIHLLSGLNDAMLEKMGDIAEMRHYKEREVIYEEGQKAESFYMLRQGKILLEIEISPMIIISLGAVKSGYSFGWSALVPGSSHTAYAVCSDPCEVFSLPAGKLAETLKKDHVMGFLFMEEAMKALKNRLDRRTGQFLKVMSKHPDIQKLLGL